MKTVDISYDLSFVILTWNSEKYIQRCLNSIFSAFMESSVSYELLIVDNGSKDGTPHILREFEAQFPDIVQLNLLPNNLGTTRSRNLAIKKTKGEFVCILDSDVEIIKGTIERLMLPMKKNPSIALSAPKLNYANGRHQKTTDVFPTIFRKIARYFFLRQMERKEETSTILNAPAEVDYAISAFWIIKRSIFNKIGLFDENIFYSPEDVDFCLRLRKAGYRIIYNPLIVSIHHTQELSRGLKLNKMVLSHIKGLVYYFLKHNYCMRRPVFPKSVQRQFEN